MLSCTPHISLLTSPYHRQAPPTNNINFLKFRLLRSACLDDLNLGLGQDTIRLVVVVEEAVFTIIIGAIPTRDTRVECNTEGTEMSQASPLLLVIFNLKSQAIGVINFPTMLATRSASKVTFN